MLNGYIESEAHLKPSERLPVDWNIVLDQLRSDSHVNLDIFHVASKIFMVRIIILDFDKRIIHTFEENSNVTLVIHQTRLDPKDPKSAEHYMACSQFDINWD
jgi:hypothetical protein